MICRRFKSTEIETQLAEVLATVNDLTETYATGHLFETGLRSAIVGRPNVGKSSLFNRLLRLDRAIVTEIPGTTRDSLTESISLKDSGFAHRHRWHSRSRRQD